MVVEVAVAKTVGDLLAAIGKAIHKYLNERGKQAKTERDAVIAALNQVEAALAATEVYWQVRLEGQSSVEAEMKIAERWTNLGTRLEELGMGGLAKQCSIKGWYYRNPKKRNEQFWNEGRIEIDDIAKTVRDAKVQLKASPKLVKPASRHIPLSEA